MRGGGGGGGGSGEGEGGGGGSCVESHPHYRLPFNPHIKLMPTVFGCIFFVHKPNFGLNKLDTKSMKYAYFMILKYLEGL